MGVLFSATAQAQLLLPTITVSASDISQTSPTSTDITGTTSNFMTDKQVKIEYWEGGEISMYPHQFEGPFTAPMNSSFVHTIPNLQPNTTYTFQIVDAANPTTVYTPGAITFTTQANFVGVGSTTPTPTCSAGRDGYCLLAPLGGVSVIRDKDLNDYFGMMYKILIGLAGVLAVIMIFFGGVQYMTTDALGGKEEGRTRIKNAVYGLIIALGSYAILNTVNPKLLNFTFGVDKVNIQFTPDETLFGQTEEQTAPNAGYTMHGSFLTPAPSAGVAQIGQKLGSGYTLQEIVVDTTSKKATFKISNGTLTDSATVSVGLGKNGIAEATQATSGDGKTPKGTTYINTDQRLSINQTNSIFDRSGKYNMGAAFINIGTTPDRGIGFHGRASNSLAVTNGCVRMYNDDLIVLAKYMKTGTKVVIQ